MASFTDRLKEARGARSQREFANTIGVKPSAYGHYETGRSEPDIGTLLKIVDATGCSIPWLLGRTELANQDGWMNRALAAESKLGQLRAAIRNFNKVVENLEGAL